MRAATVVRRWARQCFVFAVGALLLGAPARAARPTLPPDEEAEVKRAMETAVRRLKEAQLPSGTWATDNHTAGYAALPALTLLECGVPKTDPVLKRAEAFLRKALPTMDDTYELSLSILFLDRLGNRNDEKMIQGLALRLVAGQSATGGWGYKCPNLTVSESYALFKLLHEIAWKPSVRGAKAAADKPKSGLPDDFPTALPPRVVVPLAINRLAVVQDFARIELADPADKPNDLIYATTDNSDTQFALIALWAAQRHDVPLDRTLWLIAKRFQTSQNGDGGWGYHYANGGGAGEGAPMDCCGLLGLAVGHGIARGKEPFNAAQDTKIIDGFAALNKYVGVPVNRMRDIPAANLYFLWSLERVGVLYDLPTIADKDWYRWGAEAIVANQTNDGDWVNGGGYPGATPVANTCFALLFLARTNLVSDLTAALKLNPADLTKAIAVKVAPAPPKPTVKPQPPDPPAPTPPPLPTLDHPAQPSAPAPVVAAPLNLNPSSAVPPKKEEAGDGWWWLILLMILVAVLLLATGGAALLIYSRRKQKAKVVGKGKRKKGAGKRVAKSAAAAAPTAKKSLGKKGLRA